MERYSAHDIYYGIISNNIYPGTRFKAHYIDYANTGHVGRLLLINGIPELHEGVDDLYIIFINNMGNPSIFSLNNHEEIFSIDDDNDSDNEYDSDWFEINEQVNGGKRKSKKRISKKIKTKKKMKGGCITPSKMKFLDEEVTRLENLENNEIGDSLFRQRSDAADHGSDHGSVIDDDDVDNVNIPVEPRYNIVNNVKVVKPVDIYPRGLTDYERRLLRRYPSDADFIDPDEIPVKVIGIDSDFKSHSSVTRPNPYYNDTSIMVAREIFPNVETREALRLTPEQLAFYQDEMEYERYLRDRQYAQRLQRELNTRGSRCLPGSRCNISGGKRKTKKHFKKQMKKSRKKYKGGSGEAPSSSAMTPAQAKRYEEQRLFDDYLFQQTIQNQIKKNEKRIHGSSREELESLQNFRQISKKIIDKLENQIILTRATIDEVKTKFNTVIEKPGLDLNYIQRIEIKMKSNIQECKSHVETWKKEMKKTLHSLEENKKKGDIISTTKVSQREIDDHIFHKETLEKMIDYYQILIYINTEAMEDFNKLLYENLAPIKDEIVAKEFEDFDLEEKKSPMKSLKKKGKKKNKN